MTVPRLFWKIFLALWLSIMAFSAAMAWFHQVWVDPPEPGGQAAFFKQTTAQVEERLARALEQDNQRAARDLVRALPRRIRSHVFVFQGERELLGRERAMQYVKRSSNPYASKTVTGRSGQRYEVVTVRRMPPGALLEPGWRGIAHRLAMAAMISALVSLLLARYLARPLEQLRQTSRQLATGDLAARVSDPLRGRKDEFGHLAADLDEMAERLQELQSANRRLLRDVSHELRSPLARLRVALEIARNRDARAVANELDRIELESERLETLVDEVLDLLRESSESSPLRRERFDLSELLADLREVVAYEAPEDGPGVMLETGGPITIEADRELLWRAIENLLRNALVHARGADGVILQARQETGGGIVISVADRGPGLPAQQLERIFEPFYRVQEARDRQSGGHGLGLAIAAAAVRRHQGTITARNRKGGGLEFIIRLPAA